RGLHRLLSPSVGDQGAKNPCSASPVGRSYGREPVRGSEDLRRWTTGVRGRPTTRFPNSWHACTRKSPTLPGIAPSAWWRRSRIAAHLGWYSLPCATGPKREQEG